MLHRYQILIVEDEPVVALNLAMEVEHADGIVVGPAASVEQALAIIESAAVSAAILDANLLDRDITPVALALESRGIPFVIHSAVGVPSELAEALPSLPFVPKPADASLVVSCLWEQCISRGVDRKVS